MLGWVILLAVLCLLIIFKINFFEKKYFRNLLLDPEKDPRSVCPDLGPKCLQSLCTYQCFLPEVVGGDTRGIRHKKYPDIRELDNQCFYARGKFNIVTSPWSGN